LNPKGSFLTTVSGRRLYYAYPKANVIDPGDIAWALSNLCRYIGHTRKFYSVAQHSVIVSNIVPPELALEGLLHDAAEAYTGDLATPIKQFVRPEFEPIEHGIDRAISERFEIGFPRDPRIKVADTQTLATEIRDLLPNDVKIWWSGRLPAPLEEEIDPWGYKRARREWLARFEELGGK